MARGTLSVTSFPKESKRSRHVLLHPFPLRIRVCEGRNAAQFQGPITVPPPNCLEFGIFFRRRHIIACMVLHGHDSRWPLLDLVHGLGDGRRHFEDDGEGTRWIYFFLPAILNDKYQSRRKHRLVYSKVYRCLR